jgi:hypothetical protein
MKKVNVNWDLIETILIGSVPFLLVIGLGYILYYLQTIAG